MVLHWAIVIGLLFFGIMGLMGFLGWFSRKAPLPSVETLCPGLPMEGAGFPRIRWLGHSSYLIEWRDKVFLIDPVLSGHVSVAPRLCALPGDECLEGATAILVSHGHMDHLDNATLARVPPGDLYLPRKTERFLTPTVHARHKAHTFRKDESFPLGPLTVTVVPARHGGWRYPWQRGYFACGFIISDGETVLYYAGDTAWGPHFEEIGKRHQPAIAILPIGGYSPRWFLQSRHINPAEAAAAARLLGSRWVIPGHFGTYRVSLEPNAEPLDWFRKEYS